jgi:hypothetical protein
MPEEMKISSQRLVTGCKPEECLIRISEAICLRNSFGFSIPDWLPEKPVAGYIRSRTFVIWKSFPINSFHPILSCNVSPIHLGTMIEGKISLASSARIIVFLQSITAILFGSIIGLLTYSQYLRYHKIEPGCILAILTYLFLVIWTIGFYLYAKHIARDEPQFLIEYVMDTLNAAEYNPAAQHPNPIRN